jgi:amino acid transporter
LFIYGVVIFFILMSGSAWLASLFTLMAVGVGLTYTGVSLSYLKLKFKAAELERPWKVPAGKVVGVLALTSGLVITYFTFAYFTVDVWIMFILYFAIVGFVRVIMNYDSRKHPEKYRKAELGIIDAVSIASVVPEMSDETRRK